MSTLDDATRTQVRNIEAKHGTTLEALIARVRASGLSRHGEVLAMLKADLGMSHGNANLVAHLALKSDGASAAAEARAKGEDPTDEWYSGPKAALRPLHDRLLAEVAALGGDVEHAPKKGYVSLRRKKQFATLGPATRTQVELGLNLKGVDPTGRLEAMAPGAMCTHRVRLGDLSEVDADLLAWLRRAHEAAG